MLSNKVKQDVKWMNQIQTETHQSLHFLLPESFISLVLVIVSQLLFAIQRGDAAHPLPWTQSTLPKGQPPLPKAQIVHIYTKRAQRGQAGPPGSARHAGWYCHIWRLLQGGETAPLPC